MRGGEDDSETPPGHDGEQLCEDCPEGQDRPAVWYCLQCDAHLCQACHDHHSRGKRKGSHETNTSDTALTLLGLSRSAMEDESRAFVAHLDRRATRVCLHPSVCLSLSLSCTKHDMLSMDASTLCMLVDRGGLFIRLSASSAAATPPLTSASCARPSTAAARERA